MLNRAFSLLEIKKVDEDARVLTGMATTPAPDRMNDVVLPEGAQFKLPIALLWQHDASQPIGHVTDARISKSGIEITAKMVRVNEPGRLKDRLDEAWQSIKTGLVQGLSIGFKPLKHELIPETKGFRFTSWQFLELSAVTIPANAEATIQLVKSIDTAQRAASGQNVRRVVHLNPPGASGSSKSDDAQEGTKMKTIAEQITALEAKRMASAARMESVMQKSLDDDRTSDAAEGDEFDNLSAEVEAIDKDLTRLRKVEKAQAYSAKPVAKADTAREGAEQRGGSIIVKAQPKLAPGQGFARMVKCQLRSQKTFRPAADIAAEMYGADSQVVAELKAPVPAGATLSGNWAADLISEEGGSPAAFLEWLNPQTILGRFGSGGIPSLTSIMFRVPIIAQLSGGEGYWVGEGKAKPLTSFSFERTTLEPLKVANITALTEESIRYSNPKADIFVRDALAKALRRRLDIDFINPAKTAVPGISPASITHGAETIASAGSTADDVWVDIRSIWAKFMSENNPPSSAVWVMSSNNAMALATMRNPLGQNEFGSMGVTGGTLNGVPVIASDYVSNIVVLINTADVFVGDEGGITVDASREASLEMSDAPAHNSGTPTGAQMVSMWQTNSVAVRAERTINWMRGRDPAVVYLTGVEWGGEINTA